MDDPAAPWQNRAHFFAAAAQLMRHILVDHARKRSAEKRGGLQQQVTLDERLAATDEKSVDMLALNEALDKLSKLDARQARVVEMHFFGGLTFGEIAYVLEISERTVKRDWALARIWLFKEVKG